MPDYFVTSDTKGKGFMCKYHSHEECHYEYCACSCHNKSRSLDG